jgi:hypothetical protein
MRGAAAILCGVAAAVMVAIPIAWIAGGIHPWVAWTALALVPGVAALVWPRLRPSESAPPVSPVDWIMMVLYALASLRAFLWLIYPQGDSWRILSPNNLGDIALHLSFIRWLAVAPHWWPASPILVGDPMRYPPGSDLFNALLFRVGVPAEIGLVWCALVGAALAGVALWRWGRAVALAALLFNGGLGALIFLNKGWGANPDSLLQWKNLFLTLFVTQRGFLFALPAGLILLTAWRREFFRDGCRSIPLLAQALLLAALPLFSIHAALFLGATMTGIWILTPKARGALGRLALVAWPLMALAGWMVTTGAGGPSAVHSLGIAMGWMGDGTVWFWMLNFGVALPLGLLFCGMLFRSDASAEARAFVWPAALVFVACMVIRFAPWAWDNTKLMLWSWLVIAPFLWEGLIARRSLLLRVPAAILLFGSGALTLAAGLDARHGYDLAKRADLDRMTTLLSDVPPGAVIACAPEYNQPVLMLGHPVVCGYEGHLWSHGLDYKGRWSALNAIMNGDPDWREKARALGISYIIRGDPEKTRWPDSKLPWAKDPTPSLHRVE